jgi:glucose/arabinose dehydrogenase
MSRLRSVGLLSAVLVALGITTPIGTGQGSGPEILAPQLALRVAASGLALPTSLAFIGPDDLLVLEKNTGQVRRVLDGVLQSQPLIDLAVNNASERGLLGIALHPDFPADPGVYLFWSCRTPDPPPDPLFPGEIECDDTNMLGADTDNLLAVPLLGNRVDRFRLTASGLEFEHRVAMLRSFQHDATVVTIDGQQFTQPPRGNHDGGVILFGADRKLYILFGDVGRRGQLQNLPSGPTATGFGDPIADDQFGGPVPDDVHLAGVILRLNDDGTTPSDNPFFAAGASIAGEAGQNVRRIFTYGIRNSFGMAVDPLSGALWFQENGEDAYDEINRAVPGMNSGWIQIAGPASRVPDFKAIETTALHHEDFPNLQQFRWGPERLADTTEEALGRLFTLPGARYQDPQFSWRFVVAPAGMGFASASLGPQFAGDLFVGTSLAEPEGGVLFHFNLTGNRRQIAVDDRRLRDRVADNLTFHDLTESETLLIGRNFGIVTDIETGPNGNLFVVSLDHGRIYEIHARER